MSSDVNCVWEASAQLGEGPIWEEEEQALYWLDIKSPAIHRFHPASAQTDTWSMPERIGCIVRRESGGFVVGLKSGFAFLDLPEGRIEKIKDPEPELPGNRLNDGKCDLQGRLWVGSMDDGEIHPTGGLYRLDADLSCHRMDGQYVVTNGPAFSPDGRVIYHTDSLGRTIYTHDLQEDGTLSGKRPFVRFTEEEGYPDGMTTDVEGFLWVAHWGGWRVSRFTPEGALDQTIFLPVSQVTSCVFGGPDLRALYITSASINLSEEASKKEPLAGSLFELPLETGGLLTARFAG